LFVLLGILLALGAGLWMSALNVKYRDFQVLSPFVVQVGFFLSPIGYRSAAIPDDWRWLYDLNPMVGIVDGIRWSLLAGEAELRTGTLAVSVTAAMLLLASGLRYFRRAEKDFADVI
jgi:lipopolysaccharide transport system permease protein